MANKGDMSHVDLLEEYIRKELDLQGVLGGLKSQDELENAIKELYVADAKKVGAARAGGIKKYLDDKYYDKPTAGPFWDDQLEAISKRRQQYIQNLGKIHSVQDLADFERQTDVSRLPKDWESSFEEIKKDLSKQARDTRKELADKIESATSMSELPYRQLEQDKYPGYNAMSKSQQIAINKSYLAKYDEIERNRERFEELLKKPVEQLTSAEQKEFRALYKQVIKDL